MNRSTTKRREDQLIMSHSKRRQNKKRVKSSNKKYILIDGRKVKFRVTAKTLKTITKLGIKNLKNIN